VPSRVPISGERRHEILRAAMEVLFDGAFIARQVDTDADGYRRLFTLAAQAVTSLLGELE